MIPQVDKVLNAYDILWVGRTDPLGYFPDIPQVESIVTFRGCWQESLLGELKNLETGLGKVLVEVSDNLRELPEIETD